MPSPHLALRSLTALVLAAPAACTIDNLGFKLDPSDGGTGTTTTTTTTTTGHTSGSSGSPGTGNLDTGNLDTGNLDTGSGPTATSEPQDSSTGVDASATSLPESTSEGSTTQGPGTTGGCDETVVELKAEADGFYISGGTMLGATCDYPSKINGAVYPCRSLNFGLTQSLRIVRGAGQFDAMYAVRFAKADLLALKEIGVTAATAELVLNMFAAPPAVVMRVGMITDQWFEGNKNGMPAEMNDSSFLDARITNINQPWSNADGPRGASTKVATFSVPGAFPDASFLESESFPIDAWLAAPEQAEGLVLSFFKDDLVGTEGPSINTRNNFNLNYHPFLRVHYCTP